MLLLPSLKILIFQEVVFSQHMHLKMFGAVRMPLSSIKMYHILQI